MKHKKLLIAGVALFTVIVFLATFIVIWFWGDSYPDFTDFTKSVAIPGLKEGAVPQGLANYEGEYTVTDADGKETKSTQDYFFISSYMKSGPSRLYVTGRTTGYVGYVTLKNIDGSDYTEHAGGVATSCKRGESNGTLWVVSEGTVYCAKTAADSGYKNIADEIIARAAMDEGENVISFTASFKANNRASFCYFYEDGTSSTSNDKLYVGEFYRPKDKNYQTDEKHHITTGNGYEQYALVNEYTSNTSSSNKFGLTLISSSSVETENYVPKVQNIYSVPDLVQGFARIADRTDDGSSSSSKGKLVLSTSYGLADSKLYYYDWADISNTSNRKTYASFPDHNNFEYEDVVTKYGTPYTDSSVYVYFVDGSKLKREYAVPSMSEGLCVKNNTVFVLFESGCYKYKTFVRQILTDIYSFVPRV